MRIEVRGLGARFGTREIFAGLDARFEAGTVTAIRAPSGFGKSTLLAMIAGELAPAAGDILLAADTEGHAAPGAPLSPGVSWVDQSSPVLPRRTALDNAALGALSRGLERDAAVRRSARELERLGLADRAHTLGARLSGGEKQRVALARALTARRPILLADEPTASLDAEARSLACNALRHAAARGALVIIATHDPWVASRADGVLDMERSARG